MSSIKDFMIPLKDLEPETKEISFKKYKKPWVIESINEEENRKLRKSATITKYDKRTRQNNTEFNTELFMGKLVVRCLKEPDVENAELQEHFGTPGSAVDTVQKMLTPGEYARLLEAVQEVNGFDEEEDINSLKEEAKK